MRPCNPLPSRAGRTLPARVAPLAAQLLPAACRLHAGLQPSGRRTQWGWVGGGGRGMHGPPKVPRQQAAAAVGACFGTRRGSGRWLATRFVPGRPPLNPRRPAPRTAPAQGSWRPSLNLTTVLAAVRQLLAEPNPDDPLDHEATEAYLRNRPGFDATARRLVAQHARGGAAAATGGGGGAAGDEVAPGTASDAGTSAGTAGGSSEAGGSGGVGGRGTKGVAGGACAEAPDAQGDAATARHAAVHRSACETGAHTALEHPAVVASPSGVGRPAGEAAVPAAAGWEAAGGPTQSPCRKHARGAPEEAADATPRAKAPRTL